MSDAARFLAQNERAAATLEEDEIEGYAEHHAGGLYVLFGYTPAPEGRCVKLHDSWGDDEYVVVHIYDPENADDPDEIVLSFRDGATAFKHFLTAIDDD